MIYVHRNLTKISKEKLEALKAVSDALEQIVDPKARKEFIEANKSIWSTVRDELSAMSFKKCWYTEAREGVSRYQTDHYRPHGRAKQAIGEFADGYCWLAFDINNYRIVGVLANTQNQEYSEETVGKGDWFPLLDSSKRATLANRATEQEVPLLLDPTNEDDPEKIMFFDNGEAKPAEKLSDEEKVRVEAAIKLMGIKQSQLDGLRRNVWRDCTRRIAKYDRFFKKAPAELTADDRKSMTELAQELRAMTSCRAAFAATARQCLKNNRLQIFIVQDEFAAANEAYYA